jgi:hypothetical protein
MCSLNVSGLGNLSLVLLMSIFPSLYRFINASGKQSPPVKKLKQTVHYTVQPQRGSCIYLTKTGDSAYFFGPNGMGWTYIDAINPPKKILTPRGARGASKWEAAGGTVFLKSAFLVFLVIFLQT